jgi:hypothetical protein
MLTDNKVYLDSSLNVIKNNYKYFSQLETKNIALVTPTYLGLEKYKELNEIIKVNPNLDSFTKSYLINMTSAFNDFKNKDLKSGKEKINRNINLLIKAQDSSKKDFELILDLFKMRAHITDRKELLREIDSSSIIFDNKKLIHSDIEEYYKRMPNYLFINQSLDKNNEEAPSFTW